jgi:hypothetical protein
MKEETEESGSSAWGNIHGRGERGGGCHLAHFVRAECGWRLGVLA